MKRLRNHNNHGSVFRARRHLMPRVQPVTVSEGNGVFRTAVRWVWNWSYRGKEYHRPVMGNQNSSSRHSVGNYRRLQRRRIVTSRTNIPEPVKKPARSYPAYIYYPTGFKNYITALFHL